VKIAKLNTREILYHAVKEDYFLLIEVCKVCTG